MGPTQFGVALWSLRAVVLASLRTTLCSLCPQVYRINIKLHIQNILPLSFYILIQAKRRVLRPIHVRPAALWAPGRLLFQGFGFYSQSTDVRIMYQI